MAQKEWEKWNWENDSCLVKDLVGNVRGPVLSDIWPLHAGIKHQTKTINDPHGLCLSLESMTPEHPSCSYIHTFPIDQPLTDDRQADDGKIVENAYR